MYERMIQQGGQRYNKTTQDNLDSKEGEARSITKKPKTKKISKAARERAVGQGKGSWVRAAPRSSSTPNGRDALARETVRRAGD